MPADNVEGFRKDSLELLKQLNAPIYRWPGGNFVSGYDWRDGLGERDKRPTRTNPAWTGIEPNDMGMHEFIRFCELVSAEPMIAANTGFGDAYSCADEVEYANGSTSTRMGKLRAANGHAKPFNVKWWCVGNEMWGNWQLGYMQVQHYVIKHNWIEEKMRQVDPTIQTIGSGDLPSGWSRWMMTNCANNMNLLSEHFYIFNPSNDIPAHVKQIPDNVKKIADAHREFRKEIPSLKGKDIRVSLDEWNYWYGPHVFGELGVRYSPQGRPRHRRRVARIFPRQRHPLHGLLRPDRQRDWLHQDHEDPRRFRFHRSAADALSPRIRDDSDQARTKGCAARCFGRAHERQESADDWCREPHEPVGADEIKFQLRPSVECGADVDYRGQRSDGVESTG